MWLAADGIGQAFALAVILVGTVALESNVSAMLKKRRNA